jgi:gamma-glutamylcyclotransferase (GGCT)/AIG2-like uncharacterized protein YtfP
VVPKRRAGRFIEPSKEYADIVRRGLSNFGLPAGMFEAVAKGREAPWLVERVFTYGTLMRGECRESRLRFDGNVVSVTRACVPGALFDLGPYPGMRLSGEPGHMAHADLYRVRHVGKTIEILDEIEDFKGYGEEGSLYRRALIQARDESGSSFLAWIYIFEGPDAGVPIPSGDWRNR